MQAFIAAAQPFFDGRRLVGRDKQVDRLDGPQLRDQRIEQGK